MYRNRYGVVPTFHTDLHIFTNSEKSTSIHPSIIVSLKEKSPASNKSSIMLRKRSSSNQKALLNMGGRIIPASYFLPPIHNLDTNTPFLAFNSKPTESHHNYSLTSPTTSPLPLDFNSLLNFGNNPFTSSSNEVKYNNTWEYSNKVGLSILHNDHDSTHHQHPKVLLQSHRIIMRDSVYLQSSKTLPQNPNLLQFSDIDQLSEDYTCVRRRYGPNTKVTHIFNDCILDCHVNNNPTQTLLLYPSSNDFLSLCYTCKRKLEGEDIYIYRGEKSFCSCDCRSKEISIEEALEKNGNNSPENFDKLNDILEMTKPIMFIATSL